MNEGSRRHPTEVSCLQPDPMPLLQAHDYRYIVGGGVMTGIHEDNPAWDKLIYVLKEISRRLEIIGDRM